MKKYLVIMLVAAAFIVALVFAVSGCYHRHRIKADALTRNRNTALFAVGDATRAVKDAEVAYSVAYAEITDDIISGDPRVIEARAAYDTALDDYSVVFSDMDAANAAHYAQADLNSLCDRRDARASAAYTTAFRTSATTVAAAYATAEAAYSAVIADYATVIATAQADYEAAQAISTEYWAARAAAEAVPAAAKAAYYGARNAARADYLTDYAAALDTAKAALAAAEADYAAAFEH